MRVSIKLLRVACAVILCAPLLVSASDVHGQGGCVSFGQARKAGWVSGLNLRPAGSVKKSVEERTGGKVVSFKVCRSGPTYKLTVMRPDGNVMTVTEPAQ
ncbi:MAG: hypothetical protein MPJ78_09500 [Hyphomicrobiaceae bacterium]|nr:hypothetical protein [Hyphomicrobiaceae bacterium]